VPTFNAGGGSQVAGKPVPRYYDGQMDWCSILPRHCVFDDLIQHSISKSAARKHPQAGRNLVWNAVATSISTNLPAATSTTPKYDVHFGRVGSSFQIPGRFEANSGSLQTFEVALQGRYAPLPGNRWLPCGRCLDVVCRAGDSFDFDGPLNFLGCWTLTERIGNLWLRRLSGGPPNGDFSAYCRNRNRHEAIS